MRISHVAKDDDTKYDIFVQVEGRGKQILDEYMTELTKNCLNNVDVSKPSVLRLDHTKIYVTKDGENWYRVKIMEIINENIAKVMFIDVGVCHKIHRSSLVSLDDLSDLLTEYPPQVYTFYNLIKCVFIISIN